MVGFPGETDEQFEETLGFCRQLEFARVHVFPFSLRIETEAAKMPGRVAGNIIRERTQRILHLAKSSSYNFSRHFEGKNLKVLWEKCDHNLWNGYSDNYIRVYAESNKDLMNELLTVKTISTRKDGLFAGVITHS